MFFVRLTHSQSMDACRILQREEKKSILYCCPEVVFTYEPKCNCIVYMFLLHRLHILFLIIVFSLSLASMAFFSLWPFHSFGILQNFFYFSIVSNDLNLCTSNKVFKCKQHQQQHDDDMTPIKISLFWPLLASNKTWFVHSSVRCYSISPRDL